MAKTSPSIRALNAGKFSALMEGRTDLEFYPASMRRAKNCILTPQGPAICRSGTQFVVPANDDEETSALRAFVYNNEQAKVLEFGSDRIRFIDETGIQVYPADAATVVTQSPFVLNIPASSASADDQLLLDGFPVDYNLNGEIVTVVSVLGTQFTLDRNVPASVVAAGTAALVYAVPIDYTEAERQQLQVLQDVDLLYLLCGTKRTKKLERYGDYDWRLSDVSFIDGPYLPQNETATKITVSGTGNAIPDMTTNSAPAGFTISGSGKRNAGVAVAAGGTWLGRTYALGLPATDYFHAFDNSDNTYWAGDEAQTGTLQIDLTTPFALNGYTIYAALDNNDTTYLNTDFSPSTWYVEGWDGSAWIALDFQENYVNYDHDRSIFFELANTVAYSKYRFRILSLVRNGPIEPRIRRLVFKSATAAALTLTASSITGINRDTGFQTTDVGRLIRVLAADNQWRWLEIVSRASTTVVTAQLQNTPFVTIDVIPNTTKWRLGIWSDTTGWPSSGDFFKDRMYLGPSTSNPNVLCGSVVGLYENFTHVEEDGSVLDDGAIVHYIKSRQLSRIKWIIANDKGMIVGTGAQEFVIKISTGERNLTPSNIQSDPSTNRGSTDANAVKVDNRILHVPRSGKAIREFDYSFDSDGYVSQNLSRFASDLGQQRFLAQAYSHEPHTIDWVRRGDNSAVALTYNRDEGVIGWGEMDFASAEVENILVIPAPDQQQDTLWMQSRRVVDGVPRRYIEFMTRPWDFGMTLDDAVFVDCAISYDGAATNTLYGAQHLEGNVVYGVGRTGAGTEEDPYIWQTFGPITVTGGVVPLDFQVTKARVGLGFDSEGETSRLENGAVEGTAQGKVKRMNAASLLVWDTAVGQIGVYDDQTKTFTYDDIEFPDDDLSIADRYSLHTGMLDPKVLAGAYSKGGTISFKRPKEKPLPFNVVAIMPKMNTYDN